MKKKTIRPCIAMLGAYHTRPNYCGVCNGYVLVPPEHPLHSANYVCAYDMLQREGYRGCHRGFTFGRLYKERTFADAKFLCDCLPDDVENWYCFGFDTCHYGDTAEIWNQDALSVETDELRKQLDDFARTYNPDDKKKFIDSAMIELKLYGDELSNALSYDYDKLKLTKQ